MSYTQSDILKALSTVEDPDLKRDLVSLNMVKDVKAEPRKVSFTVVLTTPACPLKEKIRQDCEDAVRRVVGVRHQLDRARKASGTRGDLAARRADPGNSPPRPLRGSPHRREWKCPR